jgi:hypothetical protein
VFAGHVRLARVPAFGLAGLRVKQKQKQTVSIHFTAPPRSSNLYRWRALTAATVLVLMFGGHGRQIVCCMAGW